MDQESNEEGKRAPMSRAGIQKNRLVMIILVVKELDIC
jgi:hypothetical protein